MLRRSVTQADVAREAGVSTASVSRVLNESDLVKPEVKARIQAAIKTLNYVPHDAARSLAMRRTRVLGAIIPTLNNAIFAKGVNAFERQAREQGYTLLLSVSNYDLEEERNLVRKMIERGAEGLLLIGNDHSDDVFESLSAAGVRHVCGWAYTDSSPAPNIGFSNAGAMVTIVDHLVSLGHRSFAMMAGITHSNDRARDRVNGLKDRLAHHGIGLEDESIVEIPYAIQDARRIFPQIMDRHPTAVVCGNDVIAYGALFEAARLGFSVPEDVSITGFDNLALSSELDPAVTTVDVPAEDMGTRAAAALIEAIEGDTGVQGTVLETTLKIGGTTGPANPRY